MGRNDEFGPDTDAIRAWLNKRASYVDEEFVARHRGAMSLPEMPAAPQRPDPEETVAPMPAPTTSPSAKPSAKPSPSSVDAGRAILEALAKEPTVAPAEEVDSAYGPDSVDAGRAAAAAFDPRTLKSQTASPSSPPPSSTPPAPAAQPASGQSRWTEPERPERVSVTDVEFQPRGAVRRILSVILLAALVATGIAGYLVSKDPAPMNLGLLIAFGVVTMIVWAARTGTSTVQLIVRRGKLEIHRGTAVRRIDLGNPYTPVAVLGEPTDRGWCVLIEQPDQPLTVISPSMVEPSAFIEALYRLRPDVANGPKFRPR